jgi:hypothetical protein
MAEENILAAGLVHPTAMPHRSSNLKLAPETPDDARVSSLFAEIKNSLGVPYVGLLFRAYGMHPAFLELIWQQIRPAVADAQFFAMSDRLRASAYTRVYSYFSVPDFCARGREMRLSSGALEELRSTVDLIYYHNSLQLLLAAVALQAFDRPVGRASPSPQAADHPVFAARPVLIDEAAATPRILNIYDEIKRVLGAPIVNTDFRAFARFPEFLEEYWAVLRPMIASPMFSESQFGMQDTALASARDFPAPVDLRKERLENAGVDDDAIAAVIRATELFVKIFSSGLLNLAIAKIGFDGGSSKQPKPAPVAGSTRAA